jgi:hypothetical protein
MQIRKPDGEILRLTVEKIEIGARGVVALVFPNDPTVEIPRGSVVETIEG